MRALGIPVMAALALGSSMAHGQESFPDVPKNHWAHDAVTKLKSEGLLRGYPDGLFKGGQPGTRYELAVSLYSWWSSARNGLQPQVNAVDDLVKRLNTLRTSPDLPNLYSAIDQLKQSNQDMVGPVRSIHSELEVLRKQLEALRSEAHDYAKKVEGLKSKVKSLPPQD